MFSFSSQDIEIIAPKGNVEYSASMNTSNQSSKKTVLIRIILLLVVLIVTLTSISIAHRKTFLSATPPITENSTSPPDQMFDHLGRYIMHNFDQKKPMANFLSGLSGFWGVPMVRTCLHFALHKSLQN
jgi:disulfide bond formation protein DsbB